MTDIEIAHNTKILDIKEIAKKLRIEDMIEVYGDSKAKVIPEAINFNNKGKLILVTATSPTPYGEGKTTVSIGILDALCSLKKNAVAALREPSLGPVFGLKGGATGGGLSQVIPMEDINLHFTGDFHAITSANNLLCAAIDNHIFQGNKLGIDVNNIVFNRCLDVNDRALKNIKIISKDYEREEKFDITAASEIMAIICLSKDLNDLRKRLDNIIIAYTTDNKPIYAKELNITGSLLVLLKDAIKPNLVQTLEHNPVLVHGGPFANIAHGCSSLIATKLGLELADYCVTEAGFGSDLGALKFFDIKCRNNGIKPNATVLVTTIRALKYNGKDDLQRGICNLEAHLNILSRMTKNIIVCLNKFDTDTKEEIEYVKDYVIARNYKFECSESFAKGSEGAINLAKQLITLSDNEEEYHEVYSIDDKIKDKIDKIVKNIYHAGYIKYEKVAEDKIKILEENNLDKLPICIAKTPNSISDKKDLLGNPSNYEVTVRDIKIYNGAGFITIYLGNIITMPGLPISPNYEKIDIKDNQIIGLS